MRRRHAVDPVAWRPREVADCGEGPAGDPVRKESRNDMIARGEFGNACAYCLDDASAIGHEDTTIFGRDTAVGDEQVMEIERGRVDRHAYFAGSGLARIIPLDNFEAI